MGGISDGDAKRLIEIIDNMVNWADRAFNAIRMDKWKILAKRIMAGSGTDIQEFVHNVVRDIAGDKVLLSKSVGDAINDLLTRLSQEEQLELIRYVKRRAYPLVVRLVAEKAAEKSGEEGGA